MYSFSTCQKVVWTCIFSLLSGIFYTLELNALGTALGVCATIALFCALVGYLNNDGHRFQDVDTRFQKHLL